MNNENITVYACEAENYDALQGYRVDHVYLEPVPRWHDFRRMPLPPGIRTRRDGTEPG